MIADTELQELLARQKCYDVLTRYCRALDRADLDMMKSVYWEDAIDIHGVFEGNAHEFSEFIIPEIQTWFDIATHNISNVHMDYHGDIMWSESYLISYCQVAGTDEKVSAVYGPTYLSKLGGNTGENKKQGFLMGGRYLDKLEKRNKEWRIVRREVVMDWNENRPANTILEEGMMKDLQLRGCRGGDDPVYKNKPDKAQ
ncbi:MAG: 3-phenylpropionate/cinnamic acid dioxygenase small subunit [Planctomycetota bacterium]|jgi:3-phenylpropionate/cinnamic acid dioxygenase small subunit